MDSVVIDSLNFKPALLVLIMQQKTYKHNDILLIDYLKKLNKIPKHLCSACNVINNLHSPGDIFLL